MSAVSEHDKEFIEALDKASARLDGMLVERWNLEKRRLEMDFAIAKLVQKILHLAALCDHVPEELDIDRLKKSIQELGVSEAVREVIQGAEKPLSVMEVRDRVEQFGVPINYENPGAVFNIVLKRLAENGEIEEVPPEEGKTKRAYVWIPAQPHTIYQPRLNSAGEFWIQGKADSDE
jgi:hypothetical protein